MEYIQNISDIAKETLTFLAFFDNNMIKKIPSYIIATLCEQAAESKLNFYINVQQKFEDQQISEKSKSLIALIYYDYIAEEDEKKEILNQWNLNEKDYQNAQKEKYDLNNIFTNKEDSPCVKLIEVKKETLFQKIKNFIKNIRTIVG